MSGLRSRLTSLVDPAVNDEAKLKALQEVSDSFDTILSSAHYVPFLETAFPKFLQFLKEGQPVFQSDSPTQLLRKLVLELIHRLPSTDHLRQYVKPTLSVMFSLLETENEENGLVCLRIIIELHKQFRPPVSPEVNQFLQLVKNVYCELPKTVVTSFETPGLTAAEAKADTSSTDQKGPTVIPKAVDSLKVLAELPIVVVLMYQLYKQTVHGMLTELIPLTMTTLVLQPSPVARASPHFNKETYVDFVAVQIKFLSFLAYIVRNYQEQVSGHAPRMVQGMLALLRNCPEEVPHLRRELLMATRHILATDLRKFFVGVIEQLFDEEVLIGSGWTARETIRSLAYSILADLVHHVRTQLTLNHLALAVELFSRNIHDDCLPTSIQIMSCKLLLNLVDNIRQKSEQEPKARDIMIHMMDCFIEKFSTIAEFHLPDIFSKCMTMDGNGKHLALVSPPIVPGDASHKAAAAVATQQDRTPNLTVLASAITDCRGMVKTLVSGMKTIVWGAGSCKLAGSSAPPQHPQKVFLPRETAKFIDLLRFALVALDIYRVVSAPNNQFIVRNANVQTVKTKEEKEVLENFATTFTLININTFKDIFTEQIEYLVERIQGNYALQVILNTFLANVGTSATFATILLNFLLKRMKEMGCDSDNASLYLKLFKLVFSSVTLFPQENEVMLKPHLHTIVNQSTQLANTAQDPYNYFLLLRALFRSIGGGSHELLYQEFLPLLSSLLQGLNRLQSGIHKQYMKDLFVELCLTVPVRLSSLLPYLHMLMDPLVSALNGSQTLVSQGLRTLELCVDNLQPDFLYEHIQPVRAELMQSLWQTLHNSDDNIAQVAFRVLGKFGGSNRKMLQAPQKLTYREHLLPGPSVCLYFSPHDPTCIDLPLDKVISEAVHMLQVPQGDQFYRQQAWLLLQGHLTSMITSPPGEDIRAHFTNISFEPVELPLPRLRHMTLPVCQRKAVRDSFQEALLGVMIAAASPDLQKEASAFMAGLIRHMSMIAVLQQCGQNSIIKTSTAPEAMDVFVLVDAIAKCMCLEDRECCKVGEMALGLILDTASVLVGDKEKAVGLPIFSVICDKVCGCCYEGAWFAKSGGCSAISFLVDRMPLKWVMNHQLVFIMALMFVLQDLTNDVSSGTLDRARNLMKRILELCNTPLEQGSEAMKMVQQRSFHSVTRHLVKEVISSNENVRKQSHKSLELLADVTGKTVTEMMEPHKEILADMIPPKKHLLKHQPVIIQIALMDGNTFCTSLTPRLFSIDLSIPEHKVFFNELYSLCDTDDATLARTPCYKSVTSLVPLRMHAIAALAACNYIPTSNVREKIFSVLHKAITSNSKELQDAGKEAMQKFMAEHMDIELVHTALRPLLLMLADYRHLNTSLLQRLTIMISLFPNSFNEKMCDQLLAHLHRWVDVLASNAKQTRRGELQEVPICLSIMQMLHMLPASSFKLADPLVQLCFKAEGAIGVDAGSPFREPLFKFMIRFPQQTVEYFLGQLSDYSRSHLFMDFLEHTDAGPLRDALYSGSTKLVEAAFVYQLLPVGEAAVHKHLELRYMGIIITKLLLEHKEKWFSEREQQLLVEHLKKIWMSQDYHETSSAKNLMQQKSITHWDEKKHLVKCLIAYVKYNPDDVELLFHLLRVFTSAHCMSFHFLTQFLETQIARDYSIEQKRVVFFQFVTFYHDAAFPHELKALALQHILIPMFTVTCEEGRGDELIGGPPNPDHDSDENVVSVFINQVINPEKPLASADPLNILLLQFSRLLVEHAAPHIHDSNNKRQGDKLRRIMTFAWPCLLPKQCVDPATKYHGLLLLSHIIAKFAIHKRIVLQVFHTLLKGYAPEARTTVRQALDILTPVVPVRMEDSNATLVHWTKKVIVEEGHSINQLVHILQLIVRHYKVYFPVRQHLVQHMVSSIQRLGFITNATIEHRKLAVDLAEVIIKWEFQRVRERQGQDEEAMDTDSSSERQGSTSSGEVKKQATSDGSAWMMDKQHIDAVINFLLRLACQVNDLLAAPPPGPTPGETLSKRCMVLVKTALKPEIWPNIDIKLSWFDKLLCTVDQQPPNTYGSTINICTGLDLLTFLLTVLPHSVLLAGYRHLHKGILACITSSNMKVVRYVHGLLTRLMQIFPMESTSVYCKHEELDVLYSNIAKFVHDGLTSYEKASTVAPAQLQSTLIILRAVCTHEVACVDRFLNVFMKVIQKLHKEHISNPGGSQDAALVSDMLQLCIDMVKTRVGMMQQDYRKTFLTIVTALIEKSPDAKLLRSIAKVVDEWMRNRNDTPGQSTAPSLREKTVLLTKLMTYVEKRFPEDTELSVQFLETVLFVYKDPALSNSELNGKLEQAFLYGLRFPQHQLRMKFFEAFESNIHQKLFERLVYITCSQNWENFGTHFWIKQCVELILGVAVLDIPPTVLTTMPRLPAISSISTLQASANVTQPPTISSLPPEDFIEGMDTAENQLDGTPVSKEELLRKHAHFLESIRSAKNESIVKPCAQLCHNSSQLAREMWIQLFPRIWAILTDRQRQSLSNELSPFICSGAHVIQADCHPSAMEAFLEGVSLCNPPVMLRANVVKYLGKTHNAWHRAVLMLEERALANGDFDLQPKIPPKYEGELVGQSLEPPKQETLDALSDLYSSLCEEDMWTGMWVLRSRFPDGMTAVLYESQGLFQQAKTSYEAAMSQGRELHTHGSAPLTVLSEYKLWENHWIRCAQELGQWDTVVEFGKAAGNNPFNIIDNAWRYSDWPAMRDGLAQAELVCPEALMPKLQLLKGYLAICPLEDQHLNMAEKFVENANIMAIRQWKRLPMLVSNTHIPLLQLSQQIIELQEGGQVQNILQPSQVQRSSTIPELRTIFKTWKNRLPIISDDLCHWSDVIWWRQIHFKAISRSFDTNPLYDQAIHHSVNGTLKFSAVARKHGLMDLALNTISTGIPTVQTLHPLDAFYKAKQSVKVFMKMSASMTSETQTTALDIVENYNLKYFSKEQMAEFFSLKGSLFTYFGRSEDANKCFSSAVQLCDNSSKVWGGWANYLNLLFLQERRHSIAVPLLMCCLHACRNQGEGKCRKHIARILWLLMFDDEKNTLAETVEKNFQAIPPSHWLPWVPQLLTRLVRSERVLHLLLYISKAHPQAVYFPIRTLYLTLKKEQKEKMRAESSSGPPGTPSQVPSSPGPPGTPTTSLPSSDQSQVRSAVAPPAMVRCSRIMQFLRDVHPTLLSALEGIVDQVVCFRENWSEEVLHLLMETLKECYASVFQKRSDVSGAKVTGAIEAAVAKLVSVFSPALEQTAAAGEGQGRRGPSPAQDPTLQRLKAQFSSDFDLSAPGATKLHTLISKLKKWIKIMELKIRSLPRYFLLEERCRFLSNFSIATADVDMPGDYLMPKHLQYMVHIARFMPHVEVVRQQNVAFRRLYIRGDNGKIYPYLVANSNLSSECRREERVLQLQRMMNMFLEKRKETARRHLLFTVPNVVAVAPQMRLVEDNPSTISLADVYQQFAAERGIDPDSHIAVYYEKLAQIQSHDGQLTPVVLQQVFSEIQNTCIPPSTVRDWAFQTYTNATDFWTFRKQVTNQLALAGLAEFVLHFTRLDPDMFHLARDSGSVTQSYFTFDVDSSGHLDANRAVPFRLTSGLQCLLGTLGRQGPLTLDMIAAARCLVDPKFDFPGLLKTILKDEFISWCKHKAEADGGSVVGIEEVANDDVIALVDQAVVAILTRLHNIADFEGAKSKVSVLVSAAESTENLSRMDPMWNPWL